MTPRHPRASSKSTPKPSAWLTTETKHGFQWFIVECPASRTRVGVSEHQQLARARALIEGVIYRHEEECQACSVDDVRAKHGDPEFREQFEAAWAEMERESNSRYAWMRRN